MTRRQFLGWIIAVGAFCGAVASIHHPRPAIAAAATGIAIALSGARRFALLACIVLAAGLVAASSSTPRTQHGAMERSR